MRAFIIIFLVISPFLTSCDTEEATLISNSPQKDQVILLPKETLDEGEVSSLLFMREEEKLARDVYDYLFETWGAISFHTISNSEQNHMDAVLSLLEKYELADPSINQKGKFTNDFLQDLYDELILEGKESLIDAYEVGAAIEEIDIIDLQSALDSSNNQDIKFVFDNLMKGSRNHLRSFVKNLEIQRITYNPIFLTQDTFDSIISTGKERGY